MSKESFEQSNRDFWQMLSEFFGGKKNSTKLENKATLEQKNNNQQLAKTLEELEKQFLESQKTPVPNWEELYPLTLGEEKREYVGKTEEQMQQEAHKEFLPDYEKKQLDKKSWLEEGVAKSEEREQKLASDTEAKTETTLDQLEKLHQRNRVKMIGQGMAHSSVAEFLEEGANEAARGKLQQIDLAADAGYQKILAEREKLQFDYETALQNYELKYALSVEKKIAALQKEEARRKNEVETYNRQVEKREAQYQKEREKQVEKAKAAYEEQEKLREAERLENRKEHGMSEAEKADVEKRFDVALGFYSSLPEDTARELLEQNYAVLVRALDYEGFNRLYRALFELK